MLKVKNLRKSIDGESILEDINIEIGKGSIVGLLGRNGSGKTTLLRTLIGILDADEGEITFDDQNLGEHPDMKKNIFFVPDSYRYLKNYHITELNKTFSDLYTDFNSEKFMALIRRFKLPEKRKIRQFSKGMGTLVHIILALSTEARLILMDEPTNGLDPIVKKEMLQLIIEEVAEEEKSVLISTHHLDEVEKAADHIMILKDNTIDFSWSLEDLTGKYKKLQVAFQEGMPEKLSALPSVNILSQTGRVATVLIEDATWNTYKKFKEAEPLLIDEMAISLEDVFFNKFGGEFYVE